MFCNYCNKEIPEEEAEIRTEDDTFTAPYGDIFVNCGGKHQIYICPECGEDLEEG